MPFRFPFFRTYKLKCPDGTTRIVHKNIDDVFPLSVSDTNAKFNGDLKLPETIDAKLGAEISNAIKSVMFSIDGNNSSLVLEQRAAYSGYQSNPCAQADWYQRRIEDLSNRRHRLQEQERLLNALMSLAQRPTADADRLIGLLGQLVDKLPPEEAALLTIDAMDHSERTAIEMTKGGEDEDQDDLLR